MAGCIQAIALLWLAAIPGGRQGAGQGGGGRHSSRLARAHLPLATPIHSKMAARQPVNLLRTLRPSLPRHSAAVSLSARRSLATEANLPGQQAAVRRVSHGGLRDQDRIFTNAYMRHDHGLKGAMVSFSSLAAFRARRETRLALIGTVQQEGADGCVDYRNVETGTVPRILSIREMRGSFSRSRTLASVAAEELVSLQASSGLS